MPIQKPTVSDIVGDDLIRNSPSRINANVRALKDAVDALVDVVNSLLVAQGFSVDLWNGSSYRPREAESVVANGLKVRLGPVPPGDALSHDLYFEWPGE
jgi:hypothetical protein